VQDRLGIKERAVLLALMAEAKEVSNSDLKQRVGFTLDGAPRRKLNDLKLVYSHKPKRTFAHELTDDGWAWCATELSRERPPRAGSAGGALYAVLAGLGRFLKRADLKLSDVFQSDATLVQQPEIDIETRIRAAYRKLAKERGEWVSLTKLRPLLGNTSRAEVDTALQRMNRDPRVNLVPDSNQKTLTDQDRESAIRVGGEYKHLTSNGGPPALPGWQ
jgi:hypothetical protein